MINEYVWQDPRIKESEHDKIIRGWICKDVIYAKLGPNLTQRCLYNCFLNTKLKHLHCLDFIFLSGRLSPHLSQLPVAVLRYFNIAIKMGGTVTFPATSLWSRQKWKLEKIIQIIQLQEFEFEIAEHNIDFTKMWVQFKSLHGLFRKCHFCILTMLKQLISGLKKKFSITIFHNKKLPFSVAPFILPLKHSNRAFEAFRCCF